MINTSYKEQVSLLLSVLPETSKEDCFALHGGTAINLFIRDMPRLSVDIDLTYVPIEDRQTSLQNISIALERIKEQIERVLPNPRVAHKRETSKLLVSSSEGAQIKIEVNQTGRGIIAPTQKIPLCKKAQSEFDVFCAVPILPLGQLYGGKICAALDRQHPRDLFDIKYLLENEGFSAEIKKGFLFCLISSDRPINEMLNPNLQDQRQTMTHHFDGMSSDKFSYEDFESTRETLINTIQKNLNQKDKAFLLSIKNATPDWSIYDFEIFPSVQWKLINLQKLKDTNPKKHQKQYDILKEKLNV